MADFIRFQADDRPILVNAENITSVFAPIDEYVSDRTKFIQTPVYSKTRTSINFPGNDDNFIIVDEPFEQVCDKLNIGGKPETGTWVLKTVEDEENDPYGIFKRRWYCSACGGWQTYGQTRYCPNCGKPMRCM